MSEDYFDEINILVNEILEKHIPVAEVRKRIDDLSGKYGDNIFPEIWFEKKEHPWDEAYLTELKNRNITGACSKEFLIHMAEVSEAVYEQKRRTIMIGLAVAVVIVVVVLVFIL